MYMYRALWAATVRVTYHQSLRLFFSVYGGTQGFTHAGDALNYASSPMLGSCITLYLQFEVKYKEHIKMPISATV